MEATSMKEIEPVTRDGIAAAIQVYGGCHAIDKNDLHLLLHCE
jgi:hypothetical protein